MQISDLPSKAVKDPLKALLKKSSKRALRLLNYFFWTCPKSFARVHMNMGAQWMEIIIAQRFGEGVVFPTFFA